MIPKSFSDKKGFNFYALAADKLKRFLKEHNRKELEVREARRLLSQFRFNRENIDNLLHRLETDAYIEFKRRRKGIVLV